MTTQHYKPAHHVRAGFNIDWGLSQAHAVPKMCCRNFTELWRLHSDVSNHSMLLPAVRFISCDLANVPVSQKSVFAPSSCEQILRRHIALGTFFEQQLLEIAGTMLRKLLSVLWHNLEFRASPPWQDKTLIERMRGALVTHVPEVGPIVKRSKGRPLRILLNGHGMCDTARELTHKALRGRRTTVVDVVRRRVRHGIVGRRFELRADAEQLLY
mmetsp:Transcript_57415/g.186510  ORF Transcript_57415/g.186510 Transcript_57415/m.186510 type:complete len:213 (-) Transcript_57415:150-788(-)